MTFVPMTTYAQSSDVVQKLIGYPARGHFIYLEIGKPTRTFQKVSSKKQCNVLKTKKLMQF